MRPPLKAQTFLSISPCTHTTRIIHRGWFIKMLSFECEQAKAEIFQKADVIAAYARQVYKHKGKKRREREKWRELMRVPRAPLIMNKKDSAKTTVFLT